jgi:hypothetical protein
MEKYGDSSFILRTLGGIMSEWRYTVLQEQRFGRFSFNGQNPEVEVRFDNQIPKALLVYFRTLWFARINK